MEPVLLQFPADWEERINARVAELGKPSAIEYVLELVSADITPGYVDEETERLLFEGLDSGPGVVVDEAFYADLRTRAEAAAKKRVTA